jgi:hypothetical protein
MTVLKRRSRTVIFRVTEDEYDRLRSACLTRGARNVSDFARSALFDHVSGGKDQLAGKLEVIESGVRRLEQMIKGLSKP